jgi:hypothetical protein
MSDIITLTPEYDNPVFTHVYLAIKNGILVTHRDLEAMRTMDGIQNPLRIITQKEWEENGSQAYVKDGQIILGENPQTKIRDKSMERIMEIDKQMEDIENKSIRPSREIAYRMSHGLEPDPYDVASLDKYETELEALRTERKIESAKMSGT